MLGGRLFLKTANGTSMTELGKLVLQQARRILEANDQLFCLGGNNGGPRPIRLGLSSLYLEEFLEHQTAETLSNVFILVDHSTAISQGLMEGYIDIACIFENRSIEPDVAPMVVRKHEEPMVWVRARDFVLSPGAPIPILTWPSDDWTIRSLTEHGLAYRIVLNCSGFHAKVAAAKAGIGLTVVPQSMVPADLVRAQEYYLPPLHPIQRLLCVRPSAQTEQAARLTEQLSAIFFTDHEPAAVAERAGRPPAAIRLPKTARS